jgi:3-dehydrosphinganine reductase
MYKGKLIAITGGSSGLGLELSKQFAALGAELVLIARNEEKLNAAAKEVSAIGNTVKVHTRSLDITNEVHINSTFEEIKKSIRPIDILINNAGVLEEGYFETFKIDSFKKVMDANFYGPLMVTKAVLPQLVKTQGRLVNVASIAGLQGVFGYTPYSSSKHAIVGLTQTLRYELEPKGVKVHLACPGEFNSPMVVALDEDRTPENKAHVLLIPKAKVEDIASGIIKGLKNNTFLIIPTFMSKLSATLARLLPFITYLLSKMAIAKAKRNS